MAYRGPSIQYKIRKTTINNKTGDNFSITVPRVIAQKFEQCFFSISLSGDSIIFESGCKYSQEEQQDELTKVYKGGTIVTFK